MNGEMMTVDGAMDLLPGPRKILVISQIYPDVGSTMTRVTSGEEVPITDKITSTVITADEVVEVVAIVLMTEETMIGIKITRLGLVTIVQGIKITMVTLQRNFFRAI
jgi:hypothetical protein